MKEFMFFTTTTVKEADRGRWWIDGDIIKPFRTKAENLSEALLKFAEFAKEKSFITIFPNALKHKKAMYINRKDGESQQIGYVITGKYGFYTDNGSVVDKYIDLWVEISEVNHPDF